MRYRIVLNLDVDGERLTDLIEAVRPVSPTITLKISAGAEEAPAAETKAHHVRAQSVTVPVHRPDESREFTCLGCGQIRIARTNDQQYCTDCARKMKMQAKRKAKEDGNEQSVGE